MWLLPDYQGDEGLVWADAIGCTIRAATPVLSAATCVMRFFNKSLMLKSGAMGNDNIAKASMSLRGCSLMNSTAILPSSFRTTTQPIEYSKFPMTM